MISSEQLKGLWVCEWHAVGGLSVRTLADVVERNARSIVREGKPTGHEMLAVFVDREDALEHNRGLKGNWRGEGKVESGNLNVPVRRAASASPPVTGAVLCQSCAVNARRGEEWDPFHYGTRLPCDICGSADGLRALMPPAAAEARCQASSPAGCSVADQPAKHCHECGRLVAKELWRHAPGERPLCPEHQGEG